MGLFDNARVASTAAKEECIKSFCSDETYRQAMLDEIKANGLTFQQQEFLANVHDRYIKLAHEQPKSPG